MAAHGLPYCDRCVSSTARGGCSDVLPVGECLPSEPVEESSSSGGSSGDSEESGPCVPEGPSEACAALDPLTPFCREGECVACEDALCPEGACDPRPVPMCAACRPDAGDGCPADVPWCSDRLECTAECTRHEQCPASACDLREGVCIPPAGAIAYVDGTLEPAVDPRGPAQCRANTGASWSEPVTYCELETALADAPEVAVIRLRPRENGYAGAWTIEPPSRGSSRTLVLMAAPGEGPVTLRNAGTLDSHVVYVPSSTKLYLQGLELRGVGELSQSTGVVCAGASGGLNELWLDDMEIHALATGVRTTDCDLHLRRARVHDLVVRPELPNLSGIGVDVLRRSVTLESTVVARAQAEGVRADTTFLLLRFASLLGNGDGLDAPTNLACLGTTQGRTDASLLLQPRALGPSVACGDDVFVIDERTVTEDALDDGYEELDELFSDVEAGALREPASNPITALGLVGWSPGEPYFDVDGQPRPRPDRAGVTPGANEP